MKLDLPHLKDLEREIIAFVFERYWGTRWRGDDIPKHVFKSFAAHTRRLSDSFTLDRRSFRSGYLRANEARSSYLIYFHLASLVRTYAVLSEINRRGAWPKGSIRALEIGAGSAPALWSVALATRAFGGQLIQAQAWDQEPKILKDAGALWGRVKRNLGAEIELETRRIHLLSDSIPPSRTPFDLIICSNTLNELTLNGEDRALSNLEPFIERNLSPTGRFIVVEPALQATSRLLMRFRDRFLSRTSFHVPFPCGHRQSCPLNAEPLDWCHFEVDWEPPPLRARLEKALAHRGKTLKYSYLVFERTDRKPEKYTYRVLSDPLKSPRGDRILLCAPAKKIALCFEKKEGALGTLLSTARRGDLVEMKINLLEKTAQARRAHYAYEVKATSSMGISLAPRP